MAADASQWAVNGVARGGPLQSGGRADSLAHWGYVGSQASRGVGGEGGGFTGSLGLFTGSLGLFTGRADSRLCGRWSRSRRLRAHCLQLVLCVRACVRACVCVFMCAPHLAQYISGLSSSVAAAMVRHREESGRFLTRLDVCKVKGVGKKTFEQARRPRVSPLTSTHSPRLTHLATPRLTSTHSRAGLVFPHSLSLRPPSLKARLPTRQCPSPYIVSLYSSVVYNLFI